jgi:hypothetical protein
VPAGGRGDHLVGDTRRQHRLAPRHGADRLDHLRWRRVFEQKAARSELQGPQHHVVGVEGGEHEDPGRVRLGQQQLGGGQSVLVGHPDVHQHDLGPQLTDHAHGLQAVPGLADEVQVGLATENEAQPGPHHRVVVHDHQSCHDVKPPTAAGRRE